MWRFLRTILLFLTFTLAFSQDPETFFTTGEAQLSSGDLAGAESSFNAALKADPSFAPAYQGLSKLYLHMGDLKKQTNIPSRLYRLMKIFMIGPHKLVKSRNTSRTGIVMCSRDCTKKPSRNTMP